MLSRVNAVAARCEEWAASVKKRGEVAGGKERVGWLGVHGRVERK